MIKCFNKKLDTFFNIFFEDKKGLQKLFKLAVFGVALVFAINLLFNREGFGAWGDFMGGVLNPILSFLTFMGLLITIVLQQKELSEARVEFARKKVSSK